MNATASSASGPGPTDPLEARLRHALHVVARATPVPDPAVGAATALDSIDRSRPPDPRTRLGWRLVAAAALVIVAIGAAVTFVGQRATSDVEVGPADRSAAPAATTATGVRPLANHDHWHAAYGIDVCETYLPPLADVPERNDEHGIHTHADGIIHIHPFGAASAGSNARFEVFGDQVGVAFSDDGFTLPDGTTYRNGSATCGGRPATVAVHRWSVDDPNTPAEVFTENFDDITFAADRQAYAIAVLPAGATPPKPPSIPQLDHLSDVPPDAAPAPTPSAPAARPGTSSSGP